MAIWEAEGRAVWVDAIVMEAAECERASLSMMSLVLV
jgi:hypothetical protein